MDPRTIGLMSAAAAHPLQFRQSGLRRLRHRNRGGHVHHLYRHFRSEGWAPSAHAFGGADIQVYKRLYLSLEGRFTWVHADLGRDFIDFEPMDLGGFRFGAGLNFVF